MPRRLPVFGTDPGCFTCRRADGTVSHRYFYDIVDLLRPSDVLVVNDTRVIPGRLHGRKETGGKAELLILDYGETDGRGSPDRKRVYHCLIKASKQAGVGTRIRFDEGLVAEVLDFSDGIYTVEFYRSRRLSTNCFIGSGGCLCRLTSKGITGNRMKPTGRAIRRCMPVRRAPIAAPTAGLHFTDGILSRIRGQGITVAAVTLHVGYGTFVPVRVDDIRDHRMHEEWFSVSEKNRPDGQPGQNRRPTGGGRRHHQCAHPRVCGPVGRPGGAGVRAV